MMEECKDEKIKMKKRSFVYNRTTLKNVLMMLVCRDLEIVCVVTDVT